MAITNQLGIRNSNTIIPLTASTKRTKEIELTIGTVTTSAGNVSSPAVRRAVAVFYADSNGVWRMRFNVRITFTAITCTTVTVPITGVLFKSQSDSFYQSTSGFFDVAAPIQCFAFANTANLYATLASTNISAVGFSGDVELESEPTTYTTAANMEGVVAVDVFVPEATATVAGIVGTGSQTIAGVKTFNAAPVMATGLAAGTGNTALMCKVLTGTTAAAEGGQASVAHGLTSTKIVSVNVVVNQAADSGLCAGFLTAAEYAFYWEYNSTVVYVNNSATSSGSILSKPFIVLVWYTA